MVKLPEPKAQSEDGNRQAELKLPGRCNEDDPNLNVEVSSVQFANPLEPCAYKLSSRVVVAPVRTIETR